MRAFQQLLPICLLVILVPALEAQTVPPDAAGATISAISQQPWNEPALPRWRDGGTPYDATQSIKPYAIDCAALRDEPTAGLVSSPAEYDAMRGVLFRYIPNNWTQVVRDCVVALTADPNHDEIAYVVVANSSQQASATSDFSSHGADMSKVVFITQPSESVWMRDYGPHFIKQNGAIAIDDSHYYPNRPSDNFIPTLLGDDTWHMYTYDEPIYYSGGNFQPGPNRSAFMSALINVDNPASEGFSPALLAELFSRYQGIDTLHVLPQLPTSVDGTGHIDMWMYIVDEENVIISEFIPGSNATAIQITNNGAAYMEGLGFHVYRTPAWNAYQGSYLTHYTYTNAFRVNDRVFVITYGDGDANYHDEDTAALDAWHAAVGPGVTLVPINCYPIISASGAIHCIVMQVPRHEGPVPVAAVVSPAGGELLTCGTTHTIEWVATDTDNVTIPQIDLYYSVDAGDTWEHIATTTNTGSYVWNVPNVAAPQVLVKVVATAADLDQGTAISDAYFQIARADQTVYDFSTGAGVDKFGFGTQTLSWSYVDGVRQPVTTALSSTSYSRLATSNATGGDTDTNRYISPTVSTNYESTHVFQFTIAEDPAEIDDIGILWEGYADQCTQAELYVWDYVAAQWSNGAGLTGQNRFLDNWAGNRDGYLDGHIQADFDRYIDASGQMTFLLYAERKQDETYHDYMAVTVTTITQTLAGDVNCDGVVGFDDINPFVLVLTNPAGYEAAFPDCYLLNGDLDGDGSTGFSDINPFVAALLQQ